MYEFVKLLAARILFGSSNIFIAAYVNGLLPGWFL
jgi:hypothetical protein